VSPASKKAMLAAVLSGTRTFAIVLAEVRRQIQHDGGTVLEAIYHVVEHFGMHTGR
jgi:hypothetical protein